MRRVDMSADGPADSLRPTEASKAWLALLICLAAGAALIVGFMGVAC